METSPTPSSANRDALSTATQRYLGALTVLTDEEAHGPSLLPGWTRGHVVTHLSRNADALAGVLASVRAGEPAAMYPSQEARDADVEAGARRDADALRADAEDAEERWAAALAGHSPDHDDSPVSRTPGAPPFPAGQVLAMRWVEVEVHHADLGLTYSAADWPEAFTRHVLERRRAELADAGRPLGVRADDLDVSWSVGDGPVVTGPARSLAWWLLGRGDGTGLASSDGQLPDLGKWR